MKLVAKTNANHVDVLPELNYCETNEDTCQNDGKCTSMTEDDGSFKCECPSGYRGKNCEISPPQMYPSANATIGGTRPTKVPVVITSMRPQNSTAPTSSNDDEDDDEINNEAKWVQIGFTNTPAGAHFKWQTNIIYLFIQSSCCIPKIKMSLLKPYIKFVHVNNVVFRIKWLNRVTELRSLRIIVANCRLNPRPFSHIQVSMSVPQVSLVVLIFSLTLLRTHWHRRGQWVRCWTFSIYSVRTKTMWSASVGRLIESICPPVRCPRRAPDSRRISMLARLTMPMTSWRCVCLHSSRCGWWSLLSNWSSLFCDWIRRNGNHAEICVLWYNGRAVVSAIDFCVGIPPDNRHTIGENQEH